LIGIIRHLPWIVLSFLRREFSLRAKALCHFVLVSLILFSYARPCEAGLFSQRAGEGQYDKEGASFIIMRTLFLKFYQNQPKDFADRALYPDLDLNALDEQIRGAFERKNLTLIGQEELREKAMFNDKKNRIAIFQLYQDFAHILIEAGLFLLPLLGKVEDYRLGRQYGNTLASIPYDFTDQYMVVPMGLEFHDMEGQVIGFLGVAVVDKNSEIITATTDQYPPKKINQTRLVASFKKLAERCVARL